MKKERLLELAGIDETTGNMPELIIQNINNARPIVKNKEWEEKDKKDKKNKKLKRLQVLAGIIGHM